VATNANLVSGPEGVSFPYGHPSCRVCGTYDLAVSNRLGRTVASRISMIRVAFSSTTLWATKLP